MDRIQWKLAVLVTLATLSSGAGVLERDARAAGPAPQRPGEQVASGPVKPSERAEPDPAAEDKILDQMIALISEALSSRRKEFLAGRGTQEFLYSDAQRLLKAQLERATRQDQRIDAWKAHLKLMTEVCEVDKERNDAGRISTKDYQDAQYWKLEAQLGLMRAQRRR